MLDDSERYAGDVTSLPVNPGGVELFVLDGACVASRRAQASLSPSLLYARFLFLPRSLTQRNHQ